MSAVAKLDLKMTPEEYFLWEQTQTERHEYFAGEVFAQAGGSRSHSLIGTNIVGAIGYYLRGKPCQAHSSDMRVLVEATGYQAYPDVSVVCPPIEGDNDYIISNPVLLIEVLSPSTADFDRGGKFGHYRQIPSLKEYLIFFQDEARVEQHTRTNDGLWLLREVAGIDKSLQLVSIGMTLELSEAYYKVELNLR
jgi:Uma2 family endonuclease